VSDERLHQRKSRSPWPAFQVVAALVLLVASVSVALGLVHPRPAAALAERGIVEHRLESSWGVPLADVGGLAAELGPDQLDAKWTRVLVHWAKLQPSAPGVLSAGDADGDGYDDGYLAELRAVTAALHANGVRIIMTPTDVPEWASDRRLWKSRPWPSYPKGYSPIYAMDVRNPVVLQQFKGLGRFLAGTFAVEVGYFECWNEPNLGGSLYPQKRRGDPHFGSRVYLKMLSAFHAGVEQGAAGAVVIAGATAPRGADDAFSTIPQTFARYLRDHEAGRYFDGYSCHIYPWGPPGRRTWHPWSAVALGNLNDLLRLFPRKPFYITEFGYSTEEPSDLGSVVSEAQQARYLCQAYAVADRRYPQVKTILWFMVSDLAPSSGADGISMGLVTTKGEYKPAWYAFAGGTSLTLTAPSTVKTRTPFTMTGTLTHDMQGPLAARRLILQSRVDAGASWSVVAATTTRGDGSYFVSVKQPPGTLSYRVIWDGVCVSPAVTIQTQ
jgi:hypothetical protein